MCEKNMDCLASAILLIPMTFQSQVQAAVNISVLIDGVKLYTPQAPVMIQGRVMLPMRSIFEALDASVKWNQNENRHSDQGWHNRHSKNQLQNGHHQ